MPGGRQPRTPSRCSMVFTRFAKEAVPKQLRLVGHCPRAKVTVAIAARARVTAKANVALDMEMVLGERILARAAGDPGKGAVAIVKEPGVEATGQILGRTTAGIINERQDAAVVWVLVGVVATNKIGVAKEVATWATQWALVAKAAPTVVKPVKFSSGICLETLEMTRYIMFLALMDGCKRHTSWQGVPKVGKVVLSLNIVHLKKRKQQY